MDKKQRRQIKIDFENYRSSTITDMKPEYSTDEELNCGKITYNDKIYYIDQHDKDRIINFNKKFTFVNKTDMYPSFCYNYKNFTYRDFIYSYNPEHIYFVFKNDNPLDLRKCNVNVYHNYYKNISDKCEIIEYIEGHKYERGQDANVMKNPLFRIKENDKSYLLMHCEKDTIVKLCSISYQKILDYELKNNNGNKITWFKHQNGYILCSNNLYIHQVITGCYGNGKGTKNISVDHIDQDPLNNTFENLRIATREEQEQNSKGIKSETLRERSSKKDLPEGIVYAMLKKHVYYNSEFYNKEKTKTREFFRVEHPKLDKPWATSKSEKVSILEKLCKANKVVDDLELDIYPEKEGIQLPKYYSLTVIRDKPHLVFEKRVEIKGGEGEGEGTEKKKKEIKRLTIKMILPTDYDLDEQLDKLNEKVKIKYPDIYPDIYSDIYPDIYSDN